MSASNKTMNYDLPIFVKDDYPSWLTDWNNSMRKIDETLYNANTDIGDLEEHDRQVDNTVNVIDERLANVENDLDKGGNGIAKKVDNMETVLNNHTEQLGELDTVTTNLTTLCGTETLKTTSKDLTGAVNELSGHLDLVSQTVDTTNTQFIGDVNQLKTESNVLVNAVNEVYDLTEGVPARAMTFRRSSGTVSITITPYIQDVIHRATIQIDTQLTTTSSGTTIVDGGNEEAMSLFRKMGLLGSTIRTKGYYFITFIEDFSKNSSSKIDVHTPGISIIATKYDNDKGAWVPATDMSFTDLGLNNFTVWF